MPHRYDFRLGQAPYNRQSCAACSHCKGEKLAGPSCRWPRRPQRALELAA